MFMNSRVLSRKFLISVVRRSHLKMKILFVTALLLAIGAYEVYSQACHLREMDLCMAMGMLHYQSNGLPSDEEEVEEFCETLKEVEECMGNYSAKCLSPLQREFLGLLFGSDDDSKQLCVSGSETRARYLKHAQCLLEAAESDDFKGIMTDLQVMIEKVRDIQFKKRFPLLCCGFSRFHHDVDALTESRCGADAVNMVNSIMRMIATDLPAALYKGFEYATPECQNLLPLSGTLPKGGESNSHIVKLLDTFFGNL